MVNVVILGSVASMMPGSLLGFFWAMKPSKYDFSIVYVMVIRTMFLILLPFYLFDFLS